MRISAAVCVALLTAGCYKPDGPASEQNSICFEAGSPLLLDDATTKSTTEAFTSSDDTFVVFGERITSASVRTTVFDGVTVSHSYREENSVVLEDSWNYSTLRFWYWVSQSDRYDFVAVSPAGMDTENENAVGNLSVTTHYDYLTGSPSGGDKEDILAATYRRTGNNWEGRHDRVDLSFSHIGSAVGVTVLNNSQVVSVTVNYIQYRNLVVSADAKVSLDNYGRSVFRWANPSPSSSVVRKLARTPATSIAPGQDYTGEIQIMIPQNLSLYGAILDVNYTVGENTYTESIPLAEIKRADGTAITSWDIGRRYTYIVSMRLDGGLLVTVETTPWDVPVEGETPGILI